LNSSSVPRCLKWVSENRGRSIQIFGMRDFFPIHGSDALYQGTTLVGP
jgi:hypothetical protein